MGEFPRKSDGRRVFTVEFKRGVVERIAKGEKTLAELLAKGTDRRVAEGQAKRVALLAARKKAGG